MWDGCDFYVVVFCVVCFVVVGVDWLLCVESGSEYGVGGYVGGD